MYGGPGFNPQHCKKKKKIKCVCARHSRKLRQEDLEFKASLGYVGRPPCQKAGGAGGVGKEK
jgi:hypothetical protein